MQLYLLTTAMTWRELLMGSEEWSFLVESALRTLIMFIVILIGLRLLGKRGIKQLSVFELVVIIGLGSAAGDPMFYKDVGLLPAMIVFAVVVGLHKAVVYLVGKSETFEKMIEGHPVCLIKNGTFSIENFKKEALAADEFFSELRLQGVSQLGQIEEAIVESSGYISIFFYADDEVKKGLSVMPGALDLKMQVITETGFYSCTYCAYTAQIQAAEKVICPRCNKHHWLKASDKKRIS